MIMHSEPSVNPQIEVIIENVVATAGICQEINLKKVIKKFSGVKYVPEKFPGAIIKIKKLPMMATILLFRTGNIVCTGTKSENEAKDALTYFVKKLEENGVDLINGLSEIKIENIVSSCNLRRKIHLEKAARTLPRSLYEPEQFSGIIHRMYYPKTVILLFASGKLVCTGAKVTGDIFLSVNSLLSILEEKKLVN